MATPLEMLDHLEAVLVKAEVEHKRSRDDCLVVPLKTLTLLGCRGRPTEVRTDDYIVVFTVKQARSMLRTLKRSLAAEAT